MLVPSRLTFPIKSLLSEFLIKDPISILSSKIPYFFQKYEFRPKIWYSPFFEELVQLLVIFRNEVFYTWVICLLSCGVSLKLCSFNHSKTHLVHKKWLRLHRTTMWASSSHTIVSLELSFSTLAQSFLSENVIRNTSGKWKIPLFS